MTECDILVVWILTWILFNTEKEEPLGTNVKCFHILTRLNCQSVDVLAKLLLHCGLHASTLECDGVHAGVRDKRQMRAQSGQFTITIPASFLIIRDESKRQWANVAPITTQHKDTKNNSWSQKKVRLKRTLPNLSDSQ